MYTEVSTEGFSVEVIVTELLLKCFSTLKRRGLARRYYVNPSKYSGDSN